MDIVDQIEVQRNWPSKTKLTKVVLKTADGREIMLPVTGINYDHPHDEWGTVSLRIHAHRVTFKDEER